LCKESENDSHNSDETSSFESSYSVDHFKVKPRTTCRKSFFTVALFAFATGLIAVSIVLLWPHHHPSSQDCACGKTIEDAIARDCSFDAYAAAWLPHECIDHELSNQFDQAGPGQNGEWPYFLDTAGNSPINKSEVALQAGKPAVFVHTTHEWHIVHCQFYWRKLLRSKETGVIVEARYDRLGHVKHCGQVALSRHDLNHIDTMFPIVLNSGSEAVEDAPMLRGANSKDKVEYSRSKLV
jgi:hypothetical protein